MVCRSIVLGGASFHSRPAARNDACSFRPQRGAALTYGVSGGTKWPNGKGHKEKEKGERLHDAELSLTPFISLSLSVTHLSLLLTPRVSFASSFLSGMGVTLSIPYIPLTARLYCFCLVYV